MSVKEGMAMHICCEMPTGTFRDVPLAGHIYNYLPFPVEIENACLCVQQNILLRLSQHAILSAEIHPVCSQHKRLLHS